MTQRRSGEMATFSPEKIQEIADENERISRLQHLTPFFRKYFPEANAFKPWLKSASIEDGPHGRLEGVTVFDKAGHQLTTTKSDFPAALQNISNGVAFYDDAEIYLGEVVPKPIAITVDNEAFQRLYPDEALRHETPFGSFRHDERDVAARIASQFGIEALADILENLENSDHLSEVDLATAYAVLQTRGLERAFAEAQHQGAKVSSLFVGLNSLEELAIHLCKLAIVSAVRAS
jgi:hypothetical protein